MASLYVGDLHRDVTESVLLEKFSSVGRVSSLRLCRNKRTGSSLQYAFINFQQRADAERALELLNYDILLGQPMRIMWHQKDASLRKSNVGNVVISHLEKSIDNLALCDVFSTFGNVLSCKVVCDENGSRGYGYVHFERPEDAEAAIKRLDGMLFNDQKVRITHFRSCEERQAERKKTVKDVSSRQEPERPAQSPEPQQNTENSVNLCIKNLDPLVDDERLGKEFSPFGTVVHAKVIRSGGRSRGIGFVRFSSPEEATRATRNLQGRTLIRKALHISLIQRKEKTQEGAVKHHQPAPPSTGVTVAVPQAEDPTANDTRVQRVEPHPSPHWATQDVQLQCVQDIAVNPVPAAVPAKGKAAPPEVPTGGLAAVNAVPPAVKAGSAAVIRAPAADKKAVTSAGEITVPAAVPAAGEITVPAAVPAAGEITVPAAVPAAGEITVPAALPAAGEITVPAALPVAVGKTVPAVVPAAGGKTVPAAVGKTVPAAVPAAGRKTVPAAVPAAGGKTVPAAVPAEVGKTVPAAVPAAGRKTVPAAVPAAGGKTVPAAVPAAGRKTVPAAVPVAGGKTVPAAALREKLPTEESVAFHQDTKPSLDTQNAVPAPSQKPLTFYMLESADVDEQIRMLNEHIFPLVEEIHPIRAKDITNLIIQGQNNEDLLNMIGNPKLLHIEVEQIAAMLRAREAGQDVRLAPPKNKNKRRRKKRHI